MPLDGHEEPVYTDARMLPIMFKFKNGQCKDKQYAADVDYYTTINEFKNIIRSYMKKRSCQLNVNEIIELKLINHPDKILKDNEYLAGLVKTFSRDNPTVIKFSLIFDVLIREIEIEEFDGGRKSRRLNSKKNKRTRRKSLKKQHRRRK